MKNILIKKYKAINNIDDLTFESYKDVSKIKIHKGSLLTEYENFVNALNNIKPTDRIVIHPDYDVDGIMGGLTAKISLDTFSIGKAELYYPKPSNGYGLSIIAVKEILKLWPDTKYILTVDNGINTKEAVDFAHNHNVKVIVTDHHEPKAALFPDKAIAVVNPNRIDKDETYPFHSISGTEVIWKLMLAYAKDFQPENYEIIESLDILSSISIISDVMPVVDENRRIYKDAIEKLKNPNILIKQAVNGKSLSYMSTFNGLYNLLDVIGKPVDYNTYGFLISPILNAPRRMLDSSKESFDVFTKIGEESKVAAKYVYEINELRKEEVIKSNLRFNIWAKGKDLKNMAGIVFYDELLRPGIAGLIAQNIAEKFNVPAIALGTGGHGSGRTANNYNLLGILTEIEKENPEFYKSMGGHQAAAGLTVYKEYIDDFSNQFNKHAKNKDFQLITNSTDIKDTRLSIDIYDAPDTIEVREAVIEFNKIQPYSAEVPAPIYKVEFSLFECTDIRIMKDIHIAFKFDNFEVIVWKGIDMYNSIDEDKPHTIIVSGELGLNTWNNKTTVQLIGNKIDIMQ